MSIIWYVEQPDKIIQVEIIYSFSRGYSVRGSIDLYDTNEDGTRAARRATIPLRGDAPEIPGSGSEPGSESRSSGGSSGGSAGSDTDAGNSEVARATGSGPRVRRVPRMLARAQTQE